MMQKLILFGIRNLPIFKNMKYEILDKARTEVLPLMINFKSDFYLAGGTALALYLGHRESIDFVFFTDQDFDTAFLFEKCKEVFQNYKIEITREVKNTLVFLLDNGVKVSFFTIKYKILEIFREEEFLKLASKLDIACMKLSAICQRSTRKDYIDLYFLLRDFSLQYLLDQCKIKYPSLNTSVILKSLKYFDEIEDEEIFMMKSFEVDFKKVKKFFLNLDFKNIYL